MSERRRTVVLCRPNTPGREVSDLALRYGLDIVYTVFTDTESSKLSAMLAVQHLVEHNAEVLMIPYLSTARIVHDRHWRAVVVAAEILTADGPVEYSLPYPDRQSTSDPL